jgi:hypothetical protein
MRRAVLAIILFGIPVACDGGSGGADPGEGSSSTPALTDGPSSPAPTGGPSASPSPDLAILTGPCCYGLELAPGAYTTPSWFEVPFSIEVPDGLLGVAAELERVILLGRGQSQAGNLERYVGFFVTPSAEALVHQLRSTPHATFGASSSMTVDSMPATAFEAEASRDPDTPPNDEIVPGAIRIPAIDRLVPTFFYTESVPARMRFVVVDLGDRALLIYLEAPAVGFASFADAVAPMLASIDIAAA